MRRWALCLVMLLASCAARGAASSPHDAAPADVDVEGEPPLVYPPGEPREGELIQPVLEARVDDPAIVEAAEWAVTHLAALSDSGVYSSIRLLRIVDAATQAGVFHNNTMVTVELASPHFLDAEPVSVHRIIVMADLEDGVRSFAIDEFPVMEPDAIEAYWVEKVERQRAARAVELDALEREFDDNYVAICGEEETRAALGEEVERAAAAQPAAAASGGAMWVADTVAADGSVTAATARRSGDSGESVGANDGGTSDLGWLRPDAAEHAHLRAPISIVDLRDELRR